MKTGNLCSKFLVAVKGIVIFFCITETGYQEIDGTDKKFPGNCTGRYF